MSINPDLLERLARLASLKPDTSILQQLTGDLSEIVEMIDQMKTVDIDNVSPLAHPLEISQPLRDDTVTEPEGQREQLQQSAPRAEDGFYLVPRVVE